MPINLSWCQHEDYIRYDTYNIRCTMPYWSIIHDTDRYHIITHIQSSIFSWPMSESWPYQPSQYHWKRHPQQAKLLLHWSPEESNGPNRIQLCRYIHSRPIRQLIDSTRDISSTLSGLSLPIHLFKFCSYRLHNPQYPVTTFIYYMASNSNLKSSWVIKNY